MPWVFECPNCNIRLDGLDPVMDDPSLGCTGCGVDMCQECCIETPDGAFCCEECQEQYAGGDDV